MTDPRYPIGPFEGSDSYSDEEFRRHVDALAALPAEMRAAATGLTDEQLDTPYRDGGWTVRQVVHHVPDSHLNGYVRLKLALTEDEPTIRPYDEAAWARLPDSAGPIAVSLALLDAVHERWVSLARTLSPEQRRRRFLHPDGGWMTVDFHLGNYAWHGRHHVAHLTALREREGW